jgi:formate hydrogenlyase transcriptional activator
MAKPQTFAAKGSIGQQSPARGIHTSEEGPSRNFGPCGDVLDQNRTLLFRHFERRYPYLAPVIPAAEKCLLVPFYVAGTAVGTIWAIMHSDRRKFEEEEDPVMASQGKFASSAYQALVHIEDLKIQVAEREKAETDVRELANGLEAKSGAIDRQRSHSAEWLSFAFSYEAFYVGSFVESLNGLRPSEEGHSENGFDEIIGNSPALEFVLAQVERVAPTDSTVLVLGETGTGKELIVRALHNISSRCGRPFVKLNCAAIPFDLLESELFGHERGAFTGAFTQKIGRFEMADKGTLFLDEIGDIPLRLQPKLLRVLQEQEFERLGSGRTHRIDVRLVTATHRNLPEMVSQNEFRSDLFYRLNVFPLLLPPLRERRQDIVPLVWHFARMFARRMGKRISQIPDEVFEALTSYSWPGNVRELQNLVERAVILSDKETLVNPLPVSKNNSVTVTPLQDMYRDSQRAVILRTLGAAEWVIGGPSGAAARLGLKRTTLIARMKRLGILRPNAKGSASLG